VELEINPSVLHGMLQGKYRLLRKAKFAKLEGRKMQYEYAAFSECNW
jgi:hypothetical protein